MAARALQLSHPLVRCVVTPIQTDEMTLVESEVIEYEGRFGISLGSKIITLVLCFVPPLFIIWALAWYLLVRQQAHRCRIVVSTEHIVFGSGAGLSKKVVTIVPLAIIRSAKISSAVSVPDIFWKFVDRIFGTGEVRLGIEHLLGGIVLDDVQKPRQLIAHLRSKIETRNAASEATLNTQ